jgi:imidazole glycerol phosphate synthase glutamine amidotransferase subunit
VNVAICAYGAGNIRSVQLAFERLGTNTAIAVDADTVLDADLAVLPGVGSAGSAMAGLRLRGLDSALRARAEANRPILGICLGLQLALDESEEDGGVAGLGLAPGRAVRLRDGRVPRIGWALLEGAPLSGGGETFWFAHSYAAETPAATATSEGLTAVVEHGSFVGVQFHPEKSGAAGARFLEQCLSRG